MEEKDKLTEEDLGFVNGGVGQEPNEEKRMTPWAFVQHKRVLKSGWKNNNDPNTPSDAVHTGLGAKATVNTPNRKKRPI